MDVDWGLKGTHKKKPQQTNTHTNNKQKQTHTEREI